LQINHFYSHLQILPVEQTIAKLNDGDKLAALTVNMKPMHKKTRLGEAIYVEDRQLLKIPIKPWGN